MGRGFRGEAGKNRGKRRGKGRGCDFMRGLRPVSDADSLDTSLQSHARDIARTQQPESASLNLEEKLARLREQAEAIASQLSKVNAKKTLLEVEPGAASLTARVNKEKCVGCSKCIPVCPAGAISLVNECAVISQLQCTGCGICSDACPVEAILMKPG